MNRKFKYLGKRDREEIERLHNRGATVAVIADRIGAHTAAIYRELSNGYERDADGEPVIDAYGRRVYRAEIAQRTFERNIKNRGKVGAGEMTETDCYTARAGGENGQRTDGD